MEQENNFGEIIDGENFRSKDAFGFKDICLRQLQKVVTNNSKEMMEGYWVYSQTPNQISQKVRYIGDTRSELKQSMDCLHDLLQPKFDAEIKKSSEELYEEYEKLYEAASADKNSEERKNYWKQTLKIYRKLFQTLCSFLERLGWLESGEIEE